MKRIIIMLSLITLLVPVKATSKSLSHTPTRSAQIVNATATQCKGKTKKGTRCKNKTTNANGYCYAHKDQAPGYKNPKETPSTDGQCQAKPKRVHVAQGMQNQEISIVGNIRNKRR